MRSLKRGVRRGYFKALRALLYSKGSVHHVALGGAMGMFLGLTPTVGLQISILSALFAIALLLNRWSHGRLSWLGFNLPIAIAMTWISNPADMVFLYFIFYAVGAAVLPHYEIMGFGDFFKLLEPMTKIDGMLGSLGNLGEYFDNFKHVLVDIGSLVLVPMCLGSLMVAIPGALITYSALRSFIFWYQKKRRLKNAG